jgi:hypothetical protein
VQKVLSSDNHEMVNMFFKIIAYFTKQRKLRKKAVRVLSFVAAQYIDGIQYLLKTSDSIIRTLLVIESELKYLEPLLLQREIQRYFLN